MFVRYVLRFEDELGKRFDLKLNLADYSIALKYAERLSEMLGWDIIYVA